MSELREETEPPEGHISSCSLEGASEVPRVLIQRPSVAELIKLEELEIAEVTSEQVDAIYEELVACQEADFPEVKVTKLIARRLAVANPGNPAAAVEQWRQSLLWRQERKDAIAAHDCTKETLIFRRGWDRLGHPVLIWNGRMHRAADRTPEEVTIAMAAATEEVAAALQAQGLEKCTIIVHLPAGTEWDWRMGREVISFLQQSFPERLYRALIYPCGFWTQVAWSMLSVVVHPRTVNKLRFVAKDQPEDFLEFISPEQLPECFGGTDDFQLPTAPEKR